MARQSTQYAKPDQIHIRGNEIFSPIRQKWVSLTPEEMIRQQYLKVLKDEYGFSLEQIAEEIEVTGRGSAKARADFVIWRLAQDKTEQKSPLIVVECKADNVTIDREVYEQGENYARLTNAPFFVTHNHRETRYWRVLHDKMPKNVEEIDGIPHANASDKEIKELIDRLKVFKEDEFADLLHQCHNVIRNRDSRLWKLANRCIYGTDANDRMARTSKMNMIMHGDGHGGVHHHDGFINVNGIFEGRFDIILTNPPFGANVEPSDVVRESDVEVGREMEKRHTEDYGKIYMEAMARVRASVNKPISSLFQLPKGEKSKIKTEILFIERCLALLKPGGRLGIVLPEGIFNNPSLAYVREFCENRAFIQAVVSLPQETFYSSGASVKASLLFMQKFTEKEQADFDAKHRKANAEVKSKHAGTIASDTKRLQDAVTATKKAGDAEKRKALQKEMADYEKRMAETITTETRALLKERFPYPIFLYEAERVGITATGDEDQNELCRYPKDNLPPGVAKTCLELYQEFRRNPKSFFLTQAS